MTSINPKLIRALSGNLQTARNIVAGLLDNCAGNRISTEALIKVAAIPHVRRSEALAVLELMERFHVIRKHGNAWSSPIPTEDLVGLGQALFGAQTLKELSDEVIELEKPEIILTRPRAPSRLDKAIGDDASLSVHIENTDDAFASLAVSAKKSLTIMTPFLDDVGARWAISLFEGANDSISKELILRFLQELDNDLYPEGLPGILSDLKRLKVKVYDFAVSRPDMPNFFETFHAKVICADGMRAYVGSANLNRHSKETSMELGILVSGAAAVRIQSILEKVRGIAIAGRGVY